MTLWFLYFYLFLYIEKKKNVRLEQTDMQHRKKYYYHCAISWMLIEFPNFKPQYCVNIWWWVRGIFGSTTLCWPDAWMTMEKIGLWKEDSNGRGPQGNWSLIISLSVEREFNDLYTGKHAGSFGFSFLHCECTALAIATKLR